MYKHLILSTSYTRRALLGASLALSLVGCGAVSTAEPELPPLGAGVPDPTYALTVTVASGETIETLEQRYNAQVRVWEPGTFAILDVDGGTEGAEINNNAFLAGGEKAHMEGRSNVWAGGRSNVWAGGRSNVWAGGRSNVWAGGEYTWMPENTSLWQQVGLEEGQALANNLGHGVKVAVIDTGVDLSHPALRDALAPEDEWWDFYDDDAIPQEEGILGRGGYGHGTNVAGIVRQVAPRATILPIRVLGPDGGGNLTDVASAVHWAAKQGADVINLSLGSDEEVKAIEEVIDAVSKKGVFVVASTGNTGDTAVSYPARSAKDAKTASQRLSVTSVNSSDVKSNFATYRAEVELAAPGENVFSPAPDGRLAAWSGTSMAAPMASGALALALGEKLAVSEKELADTLQTQSFDLYADGLNQDYLAQLGGGRLDLVSFLGAVVKQKKDNKNTSCEGGVTSLTLRYLGSKDKDEADIRVEQKDGKKTLFSNEVDAGETFSFSGTNRDGAMGKEIRLYVDGKKRGKLRTDCSKPIGPGLVEKEFEVVSGESLGGTLEPVSKK